MHPEDFAFLVRSIFRNDRREALHRMSRAEARARDAYASRYDESAIAMRALVRSGVPTVCLAQAHDHRGEPYPVLLSSDAASSGGHMLFSGATGGGKTALGLIMLAQRLATEPRSATEIVIEPKSDFAPFVRDVLHPCLVASLPDDDAQALASRFVCLNVFDPTSPVPFQVLTRDPTLTIEEQSFEVTTSFTRTVGMRDVGPLQETTLRFANIVGIEVGLDMRGVVRFLRDEAYRRSILPRVSHPEARDYFERQFRRERPSGLAALLNRLEALLAVPGLRRLLTSPGMIRFPDLLDRRVTVIDLGGAPAGMREAQRFIGELMVARLVRAIFSRRVARDTPPVGIWLDELQELLTPELASDAERVLTLARSRRCFLRLFHQSGAQFSDGNFLRIVRSQSNFHAVFRSDEQDARYLEPVLPVVREKPVPGETPEMSETAERAARRRLAEVIPRLPDRAFFWWDKRQPYPAILARTATYNFAEARRIAASVPRELRTLLRTGAVEQVTERAEPVREEHAETPAETETDDGPDARVGAMNARERRQLPPTARDERPEAPRSRSRRRRIQLG